MYTNTHLQHQSFQNRLYDTWIGSHVVSCITVDICVHFDLIHTHQGQHANAQILHGK